MQIFSLFLTPTADLTSDIHFTLLQATVFLLGKRYTKQQYEVVSKKGDPKSSRDWHKKKRWYAIHAMIGPLTEDHLTGMELES